MKTQIKFKISSFIVLTLLIFISESWATANISNARSIGLAGAYTGLARGVDAPLWNPANLGLKSNHWLSFSLINLGVGIYNNSFTKSQYQMYNGAHWSEEDIEAILESIPDKGMKVSLAGAGQLPSVCSGRFAFTIEVLVESKIQLVKDFFDLILHANTSKTQHIFDNCKGEAWIVMSYNLSGAVPFKFSKTHQFAVGATIKYLQGFGYYNILETKGSRITTSVGETAVGLIKMKHALLGQGAAFDLGVAGIINNHWTISLGIKNIISNIDWYDNAGENYYSFSMDSVNLFTIVKEDSLIDTEEIAVRVSSISSSLPPEVHIGFAYFQKKFTLAMELIQGFSDRPGSSLKSQIAAGVEYNIFEWFLIRTGISLGGDDSLSSAVGMGLKIGWFNLDFGMSNRGGFIFNNLKGVNMAISIGFWF